MLSKETEQKLIEIFITLSLGENKINKLKKSIFSNLNINPIKIFLNLDLNNLGYLTKNDFYSLFKFFSINFTSTDIDYIFFFYDKNEDNFLSFNEFVDIVISDSNYFYKKAFKRKFNDYKYDKSELNLDFGQGIEKAFLDILIEEINLAKSLNDLILDIKNCNNFGIENLFYEIKSYTYITKDSLSAFFDRNEVNYDNKFIQNIFSRFNSKDINGKIVFNKFKKFFYLSNNNIIAQMFINNNPSNIFETYPSENIKFNVLNNNKFLDSNSDLINFQFPHIKTTYHNYKNYKNINEDDIQFKCSHLSCSGSFESLHKEFQNSNCKYIPKNKKNNNIYKNYLREKRCKSLGKSLKKTLNFIKSIFNDYTNTNYHNEVKVFKNSIYSTHEDLPIKSNIRLNKNLVKRKIPKGNIQQENKNNLTFNFCYSNNIEDIKMNNQRKYRTQKLLYPNEIANFQNSNDICYNCDINNIYEDNIINKKYNTNNYYLKKYQEDIN